MAVYEVMLRSRAYVMVHDAKCCQTIKQSVDQTLDPVNIFAICEQCGSWVYSH